MKGSKPLTNQEIKKVSKSFQIINSIRNKAHFILRAYIDFRFSELLSLKTKEIYHYGLITDTVTININQSLLSFDLRLTESL